jgi:hypothetical protein
VLTPKNVAMILACIFACLGLGTGALPLGRATNDAPARHSNAEARSETFLLYGPDSAKPIGSALWRRSDAGLGQRLELELRFARSSAGEDQRVLHVESLDADAPLLVWRELGPGSGRSVMAEWNREGTGLCTREWGHNETKSGTFIACRGVTMPLYLVELVRAGDLAAGKVTAFDPLARALVELELRTIWKAGSERGDAPAARSVELTRADGTLYARYEFEGLELCSFAWHAGGLVARRATLEEYERYASGRLQLATSSAAR